MKTLSEIAELGKKFNNILSIPTFELTPEEIQHTTEATIVNGNATLDKVASLGDDNLTFDNTIIRLDRLYRDISEVLNRLTLIKETNQSEEMRQTATTSVKKLEEWSVS